MNGKTAEVALAIAIGFLSGTAVGIKLAAINSWLPYLSPFLGGLTGYLAYEFRTVLHAIPRAWAEASKWRITREQALVTLQIAGIVLLSLITFTVVGASVMAPVWAVVNYISGPLEPPLEPVDLPLMLVLTIMMGSVFISISAVIAYSQGVKAPERYGEYLRYALLRFNPVATWTYWPIRGIVWVIPRIPKAAMILGRFLYHLFRLIHSERRLIAGTWAFLGVLAWLLAVPFWPCLIGSALGGVASVELIGKRLLKTLPAYNGA